MDDKWSTDTQNNTIKPGPQRSDDGLPATEAEANLVIYISLTKQL